MAPKTRSKMKAQDGKAGDEKTSTKVGTPVASSNLTETVKGKSAKEEPVNNEEAVDSKDSSKNEETTETGEKDTAGTTKNAEDAVQTEATNDEEDNDPVLTHFVQIFHIFYMNGFMCHNRKYWKVNIAWSIGLMLAYIWLPHERARNDVFLFFLCFCIHCFLASTPNGANHKNMLAFVSVVLLPQQIKRCWYGNRHRATNQATRDAFNTVRWAILIMYFMAGFHKINTDFLFEPTVSCSYDIIYPYMEMAGYDDLGNLPRWLLWNPVAVLIVELVPPIFLGVGPSSFHTPALVSLILLHLILMPMGFADFGSIAQSFLLLFVAPNRIFQNGLRASIYRDIGVLFALFQIATMVVWYVEDEEDAPMEGAECALVLMAYYLFWTSTLRTTRSTRSTETIISDKSTSSHNDDKQWSPPSLYIPKSFLSRFALLFYLWFSLNPYFGLRTAGTLTMFSNLRTEGPRPTNHLLIPSWWKIFSYQEDVVEIIELDERFRRKYDEGEIIPKHSFGVYFVDPVLKQNRTDYEITVRYQGQVWTTLDLAYDPAVAPLREPRPTFWERKWLKFRPIQEEGPQECTW